MSDLLERLKQRPRVLEYWNGYKHVREHGDVHVQVVFDRDLALDALQEFVDRNAHTYFCDANDRRNPPSVCRCPNYTARAILKALRGASDGEGGHNG